MRHKNIKIITETRSYVTLRDTFNMFNTYLRYCNKRINYIQKITRETITNKNISGNPYHYDN